jgi:hypothetical protein
LPSCQRDLRGNRKIHTDFFCLVSSYWLALLVWQTSSKLPNISVCLTEKDVPSGKLKLT